MASTINAITTGAGGVITTADSSGVLQLQAAGTTVATIQSTGLNLGSNGVVFSDSSSQTAAASPYVLKNRIINGAMVVDQRNAGASYTQPVNQGYSLDRWFTTGGVTSKFTVQQNAAAVTPPTGYKYYLGVTSSSAYSIGAGDNYTIGQLIEGFNVSDLMYGTASAQTITISFWVRSSLTGTFGGSIANQLTLNTPTRSYPFSFTISVANTWEQKTVTITGDTTGTWGTTNSTGLCLNFSMGSGTSYQGTAGAWVASNKTSVTGETQIVANNASTFYITGVQLEVGSTATPFERRLYNQELANCQRYYYRQTAGVVGIRFGGGQAYSTVNAVTASQFPVPMRIAPTALEQNGTAAHYAVMNSTASGVTCSAVPIINNGTSWMAETVFTVASGLVAGNATFGVALNATAYLGWSA